MHSNTVRLGALIIVAVSLFGCGKGDESKAGTSTGATTGAAGNTAAAANRVDTTKKDTTAAAKGGWTDAAIVAFAQAANAGEVKDNEIAEKKATNAQVKAFAREMVTDHRAMLKDVDGLKTKLKVTPDTTNGDVQDLRKHANDVADQLNKNKGGADWDKDYIGKQVDDHQAVLGKLQDASKATTNPDLQAALQKATAKVQEHLTKAKDVQAKLK